MIISVVQEEKSTSKIEWKHVFRQRSKQYSRMIHHANVGTDSLGMAITTKFSCSIATLKGPAASTTVLRGTEFPAGNDAIG